MLYCTMQINIRTTDVHEFLFFFLISKDKKNQTERSLDRWAQKKS